MAEGFAAVDVREVDFDEGQGHGRQCIADGDAGVGVGGRVDDDELRAVAARGLDAVDQSAFVVALEAAQRGAGGVGDLAEFGIDLGEGLRAVDLGLAGAEQVEVGAMQDENLHQTRGSRQGPGL